MCCTLTPLIHDFFFFFFNDTATTEIYTLSLHDALPIWLLPIDSEHSAIWQCLQGEEPYAERVGRLLLTASGGAFRDRRSEEHTSELQSRQYLVCRLLLEKKKKQIHITL